MPLVTLPPPIAADVQPLYGPHQTPHAQGGEGRYVEYGLERLIQDWRDRSESIDALFAGEFDSGDPLEYIPVPPKRTRFIRTKYSWQGKGRPMPYTYGLD